MAIPVCGLAALSLLYASATLSAGVIKGTVLENATGYPLARATVTLRPVGDPAKPLTRISGHLGQFEFFVPEGLYLLSAVRESYYPAAYGQRRPEGAGAPIQVTKDSDFFTELRLRRLGAVSGRVLDENRVGLPEVPVIAYRARQPLRIAASGKTDERGFFRLYGLETGRYWVRTGAKVIGAADGWLPVFAPEVRDLREARVYEARLDHETQDVDILPPTGRVFGVRIPIAAPDEALPIRVTLAGDTGRQTQTVGGAARFDGLAPGFYEIYAESFNGAYSAHVELTLDTSRELPALQVTPSNRVRFEAPVPLSIRTRRRDLAGAGEVHEVKTGDWFRLPAGRWDVTATPRKTHHLVSIGYSVQPVASDWFEIVNSQSPEYIVRVTLSDKVTTVEGRVVDAGKPEPGMPVFLWPLHPETRRQLNGVPKTQTDPEGRFRFEGLPEAEYHAVATPDVPELDGDLIRVLAPAVVKGGASVTLPVHQVP